MWGEGIPNSTDAGGRRVNREYPVPTLFAIPRIELPKAEGEGGHYEEVENG